MGAVLPVWSLQGPVLPLPLSQMPTSRRTTCAAEMSKGTCLRRTLRFSAPCARPFLGVLRVPWFLKVLC